jgi:lysylphosphatidylglycerol synthetase-like protein (DUF2156 family)
METPGWRRVFALHKHDREHQGLFGFAVLDPVFTAGRITHYLLDLLRFEPTRLWGVWPSTVFALAQRLADEGMGLTLGFLPLHGLRSPPQGASLLLELQLRALARLVSGARYLAGLRSLKGLVQGSEEPRYLASFSPLAVVNLLAVLRVSGMPLSTLRPRWAA